MKVSKETVLNGLVVAGQVARTLVCIFISAVFTFSIAQPNFEIAGGLETVMYLLLGVFVLYMLWDYTRLTFKKVWNDR